MAEGFITRRGGVSSEQALAPTITFVSKTQTEIVFSIKNNDTSTAVILWELDDATPDANSLELAADTTSSNITVTGLTLNTEYDVYATANVTGKVKSNVSELAITTDAAPVYTAATGGTTEEYDDGGKRYKSHTFNSSGTFEVTTVGDATDDRNKVDYLIIAGGGGGGGNNAAVGSSVGGAGGGAGGYRTTLGTQGGLGTLDSKPTVSAQSYTVTIGGGGSGAAASSEVLGNSGTNTSVSFNTITSTGGGGGASRAAVLAGGNGGSGGGGNNSGAGGTATANQGFAGGSSSGAPGGGGGAGQVGVNGTTTFGNGYNGGNGLANTLRTGSSETRAGGGGSGRQDPDDGTTAAGSGGTGGGGNGGSLSNGGNGTSNTGSGGGGAAGDRDVSYAGGNGGSGIVIIRYEIAPSA